MLYYLSLGIIYLIGIVGLFFLIKKEWREKDYFNFSCSIFIFIMVVAGIIYNFFILPSKIL